MANLIGLNESKKPEDVTVIDGALLTTTFFFEAAQGNISGVTSNTKFGRNPDIDTTSTPEDIWNSGGVYTGQPIHSASPETISVFSSSTADTSAGTGARTVKLSGLNGSWVATTETVTLNGTTPVATTNTWHRMPRMQVMTAGSGAQNAGTITARHTTTTANVFAVMPVGQNQTTIAADTVPIATTMYIIRIKNQIGRTNGSAGSADYSFRVREEGGVYRAIRYETITTSFPDEYTIQTAIVLPAKTDIKVRCESVSDNNTAFSAAFEYILVAD